MPKILVNYRRDDSAAYAGRLADRLREHLGRENVFVDIDTIRPGEDFVERIDQSIAACDVLVAVIGKSWLTAIDPQGRRRLDREDDFVRTEIAKALERHIRVILALVGDAGLPVILIAASAKAGIGPTIMADWQSAKPFTAVVSDSEANFVFAVPERAEWDWRLPETRNAGLEYAWTVTVQASADHRYALGFSLYNFPSLKPSHGDFRALLQAGGFGVAEVHPGYNQVDRTLKLEAVASANRLVIAISDPQTFRRLFSERPEEVTFSVQLPGEGRTSRTVPIVY